MSIKVEILFYVLTVLDNLFIHEISIAVSRYDSPNYRYF